MDLTLLRKMYNSTVTILFVDDLSDDGDRVTATTWEGPCYYHEESSVENEKDSPNLQSRGFLLAVGDLCPSLARLSGKVTFDGNFYYEIESGFRCRGKNGEVLYTKVGLR